jgi:hypothetical protein
MTSRRTRPALRVDRLEDRVTPAVWGNPWPDPQHLTLSFAPDGTDVGGSGSTLFSHLGSGTAAANWQLEILRAFQTWAALGNINLSLATDSGDPFGVVGPVQGSTLYGDIRIGARPMADSELAVGTPFDQFGTWSGEVLFNSNYTFTPAGTGGYDLYTVALQEAGHVFGLPNSPDPASAMYTLYQWARAGLSAGDVAALQQLYGVRSPDRFDQTASNDSSRTATPIRFVTDADALRSINPTAGTTPYVVAGDITTTADRDFYRFTVPSGVTDFFVQFRTSGVSLLQARVSVYDGSGRLVQSVAATDPRSGDLTLHVGGVRAGATYFVRVESATADPFGIGSYRLAVGTDAREALFPPQPSDYIDPDWHGNDARGTATSLGVTKSDGAPTWDLVGRASIEDAQDRDFYKLKTGNLTGGALVMSVWASEPGRLTPVVRVYDAAGNLLPAELLAADGSYYSVQVRDVPANAVLFIEVAAADPSGPRYEGNYFLAADHRAVPLELGRLASGTLMDSARQQEFELTVARDHLFHFSLSAAPTSTGVEAAVRLTIFDAQNQVVASVVVDAGSTASLDILLTAGTYRVVISGGTRDQTQPLPDLAYTLDGQIRTDPIGPEVEDTTAAPVGGTTAPAFDISAITGTWFTWLDPYSDPWFGL